MKDIRTLEEYKEDVFDRLTDKQKLNFIYEMSKRLCEIEEILNQVKETMNKDELLSKIEEIKNKFSGDDYDE